MNATKKSPRGGCHLARAQERTANGPQGISVGSVAQAQRLARLAQHARQVWLAAAERLAGTDPLAARHELRTLRLLAHELAFAAASAATGRPE